jgi:hypothetical protein
MLLTDIALTTDVYSDHSIRYSSSYHPGWCRGSLFHSGRLLILLSVAAVNSSHYSARCSLFNEAGWCMCNPVDLF